MLERTFEASVRPSLFGKILGGVLGALSLVMVVLMLLSVVEAGDGVSYRVGEGRLHVDAGSSLLAGQKSVPLDAIRSVEEITLPRGRRVFGTGAPGLCVGRFAYDGLGTVWQATDCGKTVLLLRAAGEAYPIVVSPTDPAGFRAALAAPPRAGVLAFPMPGPPTTTTLMIPAMSALGAVVLGGIAVLAFRGPRRMTYTVRPGVLEVSTGYSRHRYTLAGHAARRHEGKLGLRLFGVGMPGYYAGIFRLDGRTSRVYATHVHDGVLLEGGKQRVFVTPDNVEGMLVALREAGVTVL